MALIKTGWTYKFSFQPNFSAYNGTYTITKIYSWDELLKENISLFDLTFSPLNISKEEFDREVLNYRVLDTYKLTTPDGTKELFVSEGMLSTVPLYPVQRYGEIVMFIPLGVYAEEAGLDYLANQINGQIAGALGITSTPKLTAVKYQYLTDAEYKEIDATRNKNTRSVLNFFTETVNQSKEIAALKAQIAGLETIIKTLVGD